MKEIVEKVQLRLTKRGNIAQLKLQVLYYTILYYTILYYTILYYTILYYTILYDIIRYCTILYDTILYHTVPNTTYYIIYNITFLANGTLNMTKMPQSNPHESPKAALGDPKASPRDPKMASGDSYHKGPRFQYE